MKFSYEFPHDVYNHLEGEEVVPFTYRVYILGTEVMMETMPSQKHWRAWFAAGPESVESYSDDSSHDLLEITHDAILKYKQRTQSQPLKLHVGPRVREFTLDPSISWGIGYSHEEGPFCIHMLQECNGHYSVTSKCSLPGVVNTGFEYGATPQEALDKWYAEVSTRIKEDMEAMTAMQKFLKGERSDENRTSRNL